MPIELTTVYNKEIMLRFSDAMGRRRFFLWLIMAIGTALTFSFTISTAMIVGWNSKLISYIVFILVWDAFGFFLPFGWPRLTIRKNPALNTTVEYRFYEDHFQVQGNTPLSMGMSDNQYAMLQGVIKSGTDLYLIVAPQHGCIVDLQHLSSAQVDQLHAIFLRKFPANRVQWKN